MAISNLAKKKKKKIRAEIKVVEIKNNIKDQQN